MAYHFWDMDHTLVDCDTQVSWKRFLVEEGLADAGDRELADRFFADYARGELDEAAYLQFQLKDFRGHTVARMAALAKRHFETRVRTRIHGEALDRVRQQLEAGEQVLLLTATSHPIAWPLAAHFGIPKVIATEFELDGDRYSGRMAGIYCLGPGKLALLKQFCGSEGLPLDRVHFYGDSLSDIHVLEKVGFPRAVNPMPGLREIALQEGWEILDFRS
jgi:HAD superfamily hydrolase (TIGR01490 family)